MRAWPDIMGRTVRGRGGAVARNSLYYGDNSGIVRRHIADESVNLIYLHLPFSREASYGGVCRW